MFAQLPADGRAGRLDPLPGWLARRRARSPGRAAAAGRVPPRSARPPTGRAAARRGRTAGRRPPRVHQVLATLGYGDAIGHEVLGIQRVLRAAGYDSDIFVETADPRLEALTRDYRDLIGEVAPETS